MGLREADYKQQQKTDLEAWVKEPFDFKILDGKILNLILVSLMVIAQGFKEGVMALESMKNCALMLAQKEFLL